MSSSTAPPAADRTAAVAAASPLAHAVADSAEGACNAAREHMALTLEQRAERVALAARLGQQLWEANPNKERILARREAENRAFAETCARIRQRERQR